MKLRNLLIRPIGVGMTVLAAIVVSLIFVQRIPVSLLPDIPIPTITVQISAPDMDARTLENTVTRVVRNQLLQVNNLEDIESRSRNGSAFLKLSLAYGVNTSLSYIEINEKMDQIMHLLPRDLDRPRVIKANISDIPVFVLHMVARDTERTSMTELSEFAEKIIRRRLEQLDEIAFVDMHGLVKPEVIVRPNPSALESLGLKEETLAQAIRDANIELGNVLIQDGAYQYSIRMSSELVNIEDISNLYIRIENRLYRLEELASVELGSTDRRGSFLSDGQAGIAFSVRKKSTANNFTLRRHVETLLAAFEVDYPAVQFRLSNDQSRILLSSMRSLGTSLIYGLSFAGLVLFLFFKNWRMPVLIILVVPISVLLTLLAFYLIGLSINIISLTGLILGVGLMIDNSIIIIENIQQKRHQLSMENASLEGANEVIRPLISSALTTSSVFLPLILLSGLAGALFYDQALSITISLMTSVAVSYFVLPVLANQVLKGSDIPKDDRGIIWHRHLIAWILSQRFWLLPVFLALGGCVVFLYSGLEKAAFPAITRSAYSIKVDWNEQISLDDNERRGRDLYQYTQTAVEHFSAFNGELQFLLAESEQDINEVEYLLFSDTLVFDSLLTQISGWIGQRYPQAVLEINPVNNIFDRIFNQQNFPVRLLIQNNTLRSLPPYQEIDPLYNNIRQIFPEVKNPPLEEYVALTIRQDKLLVHRVSYQSVLSKMRAVLRSNEVSKLRSSDRFIPIQVSTLMGNDLSKSLRSQLIFTPDNQGVPLSEFISFEVVSDYKNIDAGRSGEQLVIGLESFYDGLEDAVSDVVLASGNYSIRFDGSHYENLRIIDELLWIALVVLALLFLILAAQFESLVQPLIVAVTLPVGILGALLSLYVMGESINIMALVGIIIMSGIDVNDAILKIDMINQNRKRGMPLMEAIIDGSERRIRPIVMTSLTTILAMLPILFSSGLGAELQRPLAVAVIGGLVFGTLASIIMVPMLYRLFAHATAN